MTTTKRYAKIEISYGRGSLFSVGEPTSEEVARYEQSYADAVAARYGCEVEVSGRRDDGDDRITFLGRTNDDYIDKDREQIHRIGQDVWSVWCETLEAT